MAIDKKDLYNIIQGLDSDDKKTVFDFVQFLNERKEKPTDWVKIDELEPDGEPLSKEELNQIESDEGYMTGEDAKREYKIRTDLP